MDIDLEFVRSQFPVFGALTNSDAFFENAGGSYACRQTIEALDEYYRHHKVQPYASYPASAEAGERMDHSRRRWASALGVDADELHFGPSTSMNTYVLAKAFSDTMKEGDEVIVTNQDHEANTGAIRRMAAAAGATIIEWPIDGETGLLDSAVLSELLTDRTVLLTFPHCSNIIGQENDVAAITSMAHAVGAKVIVDGVSFAPHGFPDVGALGADVYLFSLYKTYSVHQGLMVARRSTIESLGNQGHFFNADLPNKRLTPAGPDHAQEAAAGAVLDYVETLATHHGLTGSDLSETVRAVNGLWQTAETQLADMLLPWLASDERVKLIGPSDTGNELHRCPTVAISPLRRSPREVADGLTEAGIQLASGHYYAYRVLQGVGLDPDVGWCVLLGFTTRPRLIWRH